MIIYDEKFCKDCFSKIEILSANLKEMKKTFSELDSCISNINKMVGVVRDISGKTDLLALNASIEAARAGQAGRGFAIVAHEVARLAEKSQESISEVEGANDSLEEKIHILFKKMSQGIEIILNLEQEINAQRHDKNGEVIKAALE